MKQRLQWLPNAITLARLGLILPLLFVLAQRDYDTALILLLLGLTSDLIDGVLARRLDCQSDLGCLLDAVADRLLVLAGMALLAAQGFLPNSVFLLILCRDLAILIMALQSAQRGYALSLSSSWVGRASSFLQFVYLVLVLLQLVQTGVIVPASANVPLAVVVCVLSIASGIQYVVRFLKRHRNTAVSDGTSSKGA